MQGPKVRSTNKMIKGPNREEIRVVNQELLNQDSNQPWACSLSLFILARSSLVLTLEPLTVPTGLDRNNILLLGLHRVLVVGKASPVGIGSVEPPQTGGLVTPGGR